MTEQKSNPRLTDALAAASDSFFKGAFETKHNTAEEFAQDFLFCLLAFPLEFVNDLCTRKYTTSEKDLLKAVLQEEQIRNQQLNELLQRRRHRRT